MTDRFFPATVLGGRLHVRDIAARGPWDSARLEWRTEPEIVPGLVTAAGDRMIQTREELEATVAAPAGPTPTRAVWIHESLEGDARRLWERARAEKA